MIATQDLYTDIEKDVRSHIEITRAEAVNVILKARGKFFGVGFYKKNGDERIMNARTGCKNLTKGGKLTVADRHYLINVWSKHDSMFRNVNIETVFYLSSRGQKYSVK